MLREKEKKVIKPFEYFLSSHKDIVLEAKVK